MPNKPWGKLQRTLEPFPFICPKCGASLAQNRDIKESRYREFALYRRSRRGSCKEPFTTFELTQDQIDFMFSLESQNAILHGLVADLEAIVDKIQPEVTDE